MKYGPDSPRRQPLGSQELKSGEIQFFPNLPNGVCSGLYVAMESDHTLRRIAKAMNAQHALRMGNTGEVESMDDDSGQIAA